MQVPSHSAPNALDRFSSNSHRTANADLRQRTQTRRVEIQGLTHEGTVKDFTGLAPARPLFEEAFSAFCHGTLLATPNGPMAVEDIWPGETVLTDQGPMPLMWKGCMTLTPQQPGQVDVTPPLTRIQADSFGMSRPVRDLLLGPGARIANRSGDMQANIGHDRALVQATDMHDGEGVIGINPISAVRVFHLAFENHVLIEANGIEVESFHPGVQVGQLLYAHGLQLYLSFFPHIARLRDFGPLRFPRLTLDELDALRST